MDELKEFDIANSTLEKNEKQKKIRNIYKLDHPAIKADEQRERVRCQMNQFHQFEQTVNLSSREDMISFLKNHFRYNLANSWNGITSYANNIKIQNLQIPRETQDLFYEMLGTEDIYNMVSPIFDDFMYNRDGLYQIGTNGRSGGYLVLYNGYKKLSEYKSRCTICGQLNFKEATKTECTCGKCRNKTRVNFSKPLYNYGVTFQNIDQDADFEEWNDHDLVERVNLVCDFDNTCDLYIQALIDISKDYTVVQKTIYVPTIKSVLVKNKGE